MNAIDTNVLVYLHDADELAKQAKARTLIDSLVQQPQETMLLWQVAAEFLSCLRKWESAGKIAGPDVVANFGDVLNLFPLRTPAPGIFRLSFALREKFSLSHWDSLLLAACQDAGVDTLFSEDMDAGTDYDGLRIVNPFA